MSDSPTIVIVENDEFLSRLYTTKFTAEGWVVKPAPDGAKGLAIIKEVQPDVIMLDVEMPNMDGLAVLKELKNNPVTSNIPVLMLTNSADPTHVAEAEKLGAVEYLIKAHFLPSEVVEKVRAAMLKNPKS